MFRNLVHVGYTAIRKFKHVLVMMEVELEVPEDFDEADPIFLGWFLNCYCVLRLDSTVEAYCSYCTLPAILATLN